MATIILLMWLNTSRLKARVSEPWFLANEKQQVLDTRFLEVLGGMKHAGKSKADQCEYMHEIVCMYPQYLPSKVILLRLYLEDNKIDEAYYVSEAILSQIQNAGNIYGRGGYKVYENEVTNQGLQWIYVLVRTLEANGRIREAGELKWKSDMIIDSLNGPLTYTAKNLYLSAKPVVSQGGQ
jgi:hypothetical protein